MLRPALSQTVMKQLFDDYNDDEIRMQPEIIADMTNDDFALKMDKVFTTYQRIVKEVSKMEAEDGRKPVVMGLMSKIMSYFTDAVWSQEDWSDAYDMLLDSWNEQLSDDDDDCSEVVWRTMVSAACRLEVGRRRFSAIKCFDTDMDIGKAFKRILYLATDRPEIPAQQEQSLLHSLARSFQDLPSANFRSACNEQEFFIPDRNGDMPLHVAARVNISNYIQILEAASMMRPGLVAELQNCKNRQGLMPYQIADTDYLNSEIGWKALMILLKREQDSPNLQSIPYHFVRDCCFALAAFAELVITNAADEWYAFDSRAISSPAARLAVRSLNFSDLRFWQMVDRDTAVVIAIPQHSRTCLQRVNEYKVKSFRENNSTRPLINYLLGEWQTSVDIFDAAISNRFSYAAFSSEQRLGTIDKVKRLRRFGAELVEREVVERMIRRSVVFVDGVTLVEEFSG